MRVSRLVPLLTVVSLCAADVKFTSPPAGATLDGGGVLTVEWEESGDEPSISDLSTFELFLCAGGNEEGSYVRPPRNLSDDFGNGTLFAD
jgi:hypothetical protein